MSWVDSYVAWAERILGPNARRQLPPGPNDWPEVEGQTPDLDRAAIIRTLRAHSPRRWRRLTRDFRWAQRVMKRMGRNPEDVRFLL